MRVKCEMGEMESEMLRDDGVAVGEDDAGSRDQKCPRFMMPKGERRKQSHVMGSEAIGDWSTFLFVLT